MRKFAISLALVFAMVGSAFAQNTTTVYLKGSGVEFNEIWQNEFVVGDIEAGSTPSVWHLVYNKNVNDVTYMQLEFTNGVIWTWEPDMGFSVNGGGNNPGWVIVAPYDWELAYVDRGNNNESGCYLETKASGNGLNFNISGFTKGAAAPIVEPEPELTYNFWAGVHLDVEGGTNTVTMANGERFSTGQGWGFTYIKVEGLSKSKPLTFDIVGNKQTYGTAELSVNENDELVIILEGISLASGKEVIKVMLTADESWLLNNNQGKYALKMPAPAKTDGKYVIVVPSTKFNLADFIAD